MILLSSVNLGSMFKYILIFLMVIVIKLGHCQPTIELVTCPPNGGTATIIGTNLNSPNYPISNCVIDLIPNVQCNIVIINSTYATCDSIPSGRGDQSMTCTYLDNNNNIQIEVPFQYDLPVLISSSSTNPFGTLKITGTGFDSLNNNVNILLNSETITNYCSCDNDILITCSFLPATSYSGNIQITITSVNYNGYSNIIFAYLNPYLIDINSGSPFSYPNNGFMIISGKFFHPTLINQINILTNPVTVINTEYLDGSLLVVVPPYNSVSRLFYAAYTEGQITLIGNSIIYKVTGPKILTQTQSSLDYIVIGSGFGQLASDFILKCGGITVPTADITIITEFAQIKFRIPSGTTTGNIVLSNIDGVVSNSKTLLPVILDVSSPRVDGTSIITINGEFFVEMGTYKFILDSSTLQTSCTKVNNTQLTCQSISSSGSQTAHIKSPSGVISNTIQFDYQSPTITNISPTIYSDTAMLMTITGDNFAGTPTIKFNQKICQLVNLANVNKLTCSISSPEATIGSIQVIVTVNGLSNTAYQFLYDSMGIFSTTYDLELNQLNIIGSNFSSLSDSQIKLVTPNIVTYTNCNFGNSTLIQCEIPLMASSGSIIVTTSIGTSAIDIDFIPVILNCPLSNTVGESITVQTRFVIPPIQIYFNSQLITSNYQDSVSFIFTSPSGSGTNNNLTLSSNTNQVTYYQFKYSPPITNTIQQETNQYNILVTLIGENFSNDLSVVKVNYLNKNDWEIYSLQPTVIIFIGSKPRNGNITVTVNGQTSLEKFETFLPKGSSTSKPLTKGGELIINGEFLQVPQEFFYVLYNQVEIQNNCQFFDRYLDCDIGPGAGNFEVLVGYYQDQSTYNTSIVYGHFQIPIVTVSTSLPYQTAGNITITGVSFSNESLIVTVGTIECQEPVALDYEHIQCYLDSSQLDNSTWNVLVNVSGLIGEEKVFLSSFDKECPNNCSDKGICNIKTGSCQCNSTFGSYDCSNKDLKSISSTNSNLSISNPSNSKFMMKPYAVREITPAGEFIQTQYFSDHDFNITSIQGSIIKGYFIELSTPVAIEFKSYQNDEIVDFAGEQIQMFSNSIQYFLTIQDWPFADNDNDLQVIYQVQSTEKEVKDCKSTELISTRFQIGSYTPLSNSSDWILLETPSSILNLKFMDRLYLDHQVERLNIISLERNDSIYSSLNNDQSLNILLGSKSNSFVDFIEIGSPILNIYSKQVIKCDIINSSSSSNSAEIQNDSSNNSKKWLIPVIVVVSVVGVAGILVGLYFGKKALDKQKVHGDLDSRLKNLYSKNKK